MCNIEQYTRKLPLGLTFPLSHSLFLGTWVDISYYGGWFWGWLLAPVASNATGRYSSQHMQSNGVVITYYMQVSTLLLFSALSFSSLSLSLSLSTLHPSPSLPPYLPPSLPLHLSTHLSGKSEFFDGELGILGDPLRVVGFLIPFS